MWEGGGERGKEKVWEVEYRRAADPHRGSALPSCPLYEEADSERSKVNLLHRQTSVPSTIEIT